MDTAIQRLNETMQKREEMIEQILRSDEYRYLPDEKYYQLEKKLLHASFQYLQNKVTLKTHNT